MLSGLAAAFCVDAGVVTRQRRRVMTEALGHLRNAVAGVEQTPGEKVPDLVWAERPHPGLGGADGAGSGGWNSRTPCRPTAAVA